MKKVLNASALLLAVLFSASAQSQFSIGGQASFQKLFGGTGLNNFGLGIKGEYAFGDKTTMFGGFNYYFASKYDESRYAYAYSSLTTPQQIEFATEVKINFMHIGIGAKRYFVGDYEDSFGFYGLLEAGYLIAPVKENFVETFDQTEYYTTIEDGEKEMLSNFTIGGGIGAEFDLDFGYLFIDAMLRLPANQVNGSFVSIQIPAGAVFNAGVRVPF